VTIKILLKRAYSPRCDTDGYRVLADRLWPRGVRKADAGIDEWLKEWAPSTELRKWFDHDPVRWAQFKTKYLKELRPWQLEVPGLINRAVPGPLTLVYGAKDETYNHAIVLRDFILEYA
jgi:uncharacterized protein YeaO (DUF488 family)